MQLGLTMPVTISDRMVTNCGAKMCLTGCYILGVLCVKVSDLVQPKMCVSAANSTTIKILVAVFIVISGVNTRIGD